MRCEACGRRWEHRARFCGRCGDALGRRRHAPRPREPEDPPHAQRTGRATVLAGVALLVTVALGAVALTGSVAGTASRPAPDGPVQVPTATSDHGEVTTRAAARALRPVDCGDHLQELPHAIRRPSLHLGALEWRDGRLCAPLRPLERTVPSCPPPQLACAIP